MIPHCSRKYFNFLIIKLHFVPINNLAYLGDDGIVKIISNPY